MGAVLPRLVLRVPPREHHLVARGGEPHKPAVLVGDAATAKGEGRRVKDEGWRAKGERWRVEGEG